MTDSMQPGAESIDKYLIEHLVEQVKAARSTIASLKAANAELRRGVEAAYDGGYYVGRAVGTAKALGAL